MRCDVIAVGTELLLGQIVDTNSSWIGEQLALNGIDSLLQVKVGDTVLLAQWGGTDIKLDGEELLMVSEEELLAKLQSISDAYPDQAVILRGSSEANFQSIINVLDEIKKAGIWNVAFATTKPQT